MNRNIYFFYYPNKADNKMSILTEVPDEIIREYLLHLDAQSLQSACRLNRQYANICRDDVFWKWKIQVDYPDLELEEPSFDSWKETWIFLYSTVKFHFKILLNIDEYVIGPVPSDHYEPFYDDDDYLEMLMRDHEYYNLPLEYIRDITSDITSDITLFDTNYIPDEITVKKLRHVMPNIIEQILYRLDSIYVEKELFGKSLPITDTINIFFNIKGNDIVVYLKPWRTISEVEMNFLHDRFSRLLTRRLIGALGTSYFHQNPQFQYIYRNPQFQRVIQEEYLDNINYNPNYIKGVRSVQIFVVPFYRIKEFEHNVIEI